MLTANDYLARRDAAWMGGIYRRLGLSVGVVQQDMTERANGARPMRCDITYGTANEVGFDYLRDQLALEPGDQVLRPFATAVLDEADSALIDEARIPLVIAGGDADAGDHRRSRRRRPCGDCGRPIARPTRAAATSRSRRRDSPRSSALLGCDLYASGAGAA